MLDAIILCGGRGTRLNSVLSDCPKPLAPVLGKPFLDYLISYLATSGMVRAVTLAIHHMSDRFIEHYATHVPPLPIRFVREPRPYGTGGALMNALSANDSETVLCLNGDSIVGCDLAKLVAAHRKFQTGVTLALVAVENTERYGRVVCDDTGQILSFSEKSASAGPGLINAGVYVIDKSTLGPWDGEVLSMETDILPRLAREGRLHGIRVKGPFIDIGMPETYAAAGDFLRGFTMAEGSVDRSKHRMNSTP